jgi:DNA repair photolyase
MIASAAQEPIPDLTAVRPLAEHEIAAKVVLNRLRPINGRTMGDWSINPYRGCQHGCAYCYARRSHITFDLDGGREFEREIFVKVNAADVLREELRHRRRPWRHPIIIGTIVDPYQPVEGHRRVMRGILTELLAARAPVQIITKNSMVLRDADLLGEIARTSYCAVFVSITTLDAALARRMEPATPPPLKRLATVQRLVAAGVPAGVMAAPIVPWLTDAPGAIEALARAVADHQAQWMASGVLRLHPDVRPWFLEWLRGERPDLVRWYERMYQHTEVPAAYHDRVHARVDAIRTDLGLPGGPPRFVPPVQQLALFDDASEESVALQD